MKSAPSMLLFRPWMLPLLFVVATVIAYSPALNGSPIWDDDAHMTRFELRSLEGLGQIWTQLGATRQYYPLVHSVFWLEWAWWGPAVFPYHLINVLLHAASAVVLVKILLELEIPGAWLAGAIFALHPVQVESVAWISELKNTLSGFFCLSAALAYLKFDRHKNRAAYGLALGLFCLGLISKSVIASLPAALLVVIWWRRGKVAKSDILPLLPFLVIGVAAGLFTAWVERYFIGAEGTAFDFSPVDRCLIAGRVFWFYLAKLVWPANLIFTYPRWQIDRALWWQYLFPAAAAILVATLWWLRTRTRAPLAAFLIFGGTLFPVLGFVNVYPFLYSFVADHFQYLASIGVITLAAGGITLGLRRLRLERRSAGYAILYALLLLLGVLTYRQAGMYRDAQTLYRTTLERNPDSWMAHNNLGIDLAEKGQLDEAIAHYEQARAIEPNNAQAYTNLANAFLRQGRPLEAIPNYEKTLQLAPASVQPKNNLAWLLATSANPALRNPARALQLAEEAVQTSQGKDPVILRTLAAAYAQNGRFPEAVKTIERGLHLAEGNDSWLRTVEKEAELYRARRPLRR